MGKLDSAEQIDSSRCACGAYTDCTWHTELFEIEMYRRHPGLALRRKRREQTQNVGEESRIVLDAEKRGDSCSFVIRGLLPGHDAWLTAAGMHR